MLKPRTPITSEASMAARYSQRARTALRTRERKPRRLCSAAGASTSSIAMLLARRVQPRHDCLDVVTLKHEILHVEAGQQLQGDLRHVRSHHSSHAQARFSLPIEADAARRQVLL